MSKINKENGIVSIDSSEGGVVLFDYKERFGSCVVIGINTVFFSKFELEELINHLTELKNKMQ